MAFHSSTVEGVYEEINKRQQMVGSLSLVGFDDEEYRLLRKLARAIVVFQHQWDVWSNTKKKQARRVFLAFACEYVRRNKYTTDNVFWEDYQKALNISEGRFQNFIAYELLWASYKEGGIEQKQKENRLIVRSLIDDVLTTAKLLSHQFVDFFCWYYLHKLQAPITQSIIREYEKQEKKQLPILEKALSALDRDCEILAKVVEYSVEHNLFLLHSQWDLYVQRIVDELGTRYDPTRLHLLHDKTVLQRLIIKLQNHRTPIQFLKELEINKTKIVRTPERQNILALKASQQWRPPDLRLGLYKIGELEYRVVPFTWVSLEMIAEWQEKTVIHFRRGNYLGYKKKTSFEVKINRRQDEVHPCTLLNGTQCYIWAAKVPIGEPLIIDGHSYLESEGLNWEMSSELGFSQDGEPVIKIVLDWLKAYFPNNGGERIRICTSQGQEETCTLQIEQPSGTCQLFRAISFPILSLAQPLTVSVYLEDHLLGSKEIQPESAYLFSSRTYQRVPPLTKRDWGEQYYYLFTSPNTELLFGEGFEVEKLDTDFGNYSIYQVNWKDTTKQFFLQADKFLWAFQQQRYFAIQVNSQQTDAIVCLKKHQIYRFDEQIRILTNWQFESLLVTCRLLQDNEMIEIQGELKSKGEYQYVLSQATQQKLNAKTVGRYLYGEWLLFLYENEQLLDETTVALIPELHVSQANPDQPVQEKTQKFVKVVSPHLMMWDAQNNQERQMMLLPYYPRALIQSWDKEIKIPPGIVHLTSQEIKLPLVFPSIGQDVEIKVHPVLFGFRLYQRQDNHVNTPYQQVSELDYYLLGTSALYIFSKANQTVILSIDEEMIWSGQTNRDGYLLCSKLTFLLNHCVRERTEFNIINEGLISTFSVRWTPRVLKINVVEDRVFLTLDGPRKTAVIMCFVDSTGEVLSQKLIACQAERFIESVETSTVKIKEAFCYVVLSYRLSNGDVLSSAQQWRLALLRQSPIPSEWLRAGIGLSDEMLSNFVLWSK